MITIKPEKILLLAPDDDIQFQYTAEASTAEAIEEIVLASQKAPSNDWNAFVATVNKVAVKHGLCLAANDNYNALIHPGYITVRGDRYPIAHIEKAVQKPQSANLLERAKIAKAIGAEFMTITHAEAEMLYSERGNKNESGN